MRLVEEENYQDFRQNLRRFVERDVAPHAAKVDR